jgi:glycosyltransferase involved in cell wall biosynthesis
MANLVSCVIPVYNGERYLHETLDSVCAQTHEAVEIIVIDDGSTDGTATAVREYAAKIRYLRQDNAGPAAARNRGIAAASGEFVAFLDADDLWHPRKLEFQLERFRSRPELAASVTMVQNFWSPDLNFHMDDTNRDLLRPVSGFGPSALMVRSEALESLGGFDESTAHVHTADWFARARDCGAVIELLEQVLVKRRLHASNRSAQLADASRDEFLQLVKTRLDLRRDAVARADPELSPQPAALRRD